MPSYYTCGHLEQHDDEDNYTNGSYALWEAYDDDGDIVMCYGCLCNDCMPIYGARKCKIGGVEGCALHVQNDRVCCVYDNKEMLWKL